MPENTPNVKHLASVYQIVVGEKKGKLLYKRDKKGDYASFCV